MVHELSHRFFEIVNDEKRSATAVKQPILQLLDMRPVANTFRLQLSDGQYIWSSCAVFEGLVDVCNDEKPNLPLILRIKQYDTNVKINERGYSRLTLCIRDMEILERRVPKIGNPVSLSAILDQKSRQGSSATGVMDTENKNPTGAPSAKASTPRRPVNYGGGFSSDVTPIAMITPYVSKWRVCGLASQKSNVRNVKSARGEFKVFSFTLSDKNGSDLRVSAFGDVADRLFTIIQNGDMYYLTGSPTIVKAADKRYNSTGHDYEVTVRNDNDIVHCTDRPLIGLAPLKLNVTPLDKISAAVGKNVDILAVVEKVEDVTEITARATGDVLRKRNVNLIDESKTMVQMVLWSDKATNFTVMDGDHPIIGIKGALVKEFQGSFSLSIGDSCRMEIDANCKGADSLADWYQNERPNAVISSVSSSGGAGGGFVRDLLTIGMATAAKIGEHSDRGEYFNIVAMVNNVRTENIVYKACASEGCKKKVSEMDGQYRCEKCDITRDSFKYVLMMGCELADSTGTYWVTIFEERAKELLKMDADQIGTLQSTNTEQFNQVIEQVRFRPFHFRIRSKMETFNDMQNLRWSVYDVKPVPYPEYLTVLRQSVEEMHL